VHVAAFNPDWLTPNPDALSATLDRWADFKLKGLYRNVPYTLARVGTVQEEVQDERLSGTLGTTDRDHTNVARYLANHLEGLFVELKSLEVI
jgi:hypothetical protein